MKKFVIRFIISFLAIFVLQQIGHYDFICYLVAFTIGCISMAIEME